RLSVQEYLASRSHPSPVKATLVAYARQEADAPKVIVDKTASAEANGQIDACQHKDDQIECPTNRCSSGEVEDKRRGNKKCCADALGEAVRSGVILDNARLQ